MKALERPYKLQKDKKIRELMTTTEFADSVGVNKFAIIRDCNSGYLPCFKLSNRFVILAKDYFDFVEKGEN